MSQLKRSKHLQIPLEEIKKATKNFEVCIGKGGYGNVYKGELVISGKPTPVAIKRLNEQNGQGLKEFLTEIQLLSAQKHPNLICFHGYCDEEKEKIIVYEYAERGSLDRYLRRDSATHTLTWVQRLKICIGAARGLDYLHNHVGKHQTIIHRDIKSANILIDENWVAKVSDLGLSKLISLTCLNRSEVISHPCGTHGYCEPEYIHTKILKKQSDVYSFGMVLFEVMCGRLCTIKDDSGFMLSSSSVKKYYEENRLDEILDPSIKGEIDLIPLNRFATIAYRCLQDDREQRPTMGLVVKELRESLKLQTSQSSGSNSYSKMESQSSSSKPYMITESQSSSSKSFSKAEYQSSSSKSYLARESQSLSSKSKKGSQSAMESRLEKVMGIFELFDLNQDSGLNKNELEALVVATDPVLKDCSQEQISSRIDELFSLYEKFTDGEKGLTCGGLLRIYDEGHGDLDLDFEVLGLKAKSKYNDKEPTFNSWERSEKVWRNFQKYDLNNDGGLNRDELAALIVAANPNFTYSEEGICNTLDGLFSQYEKYIDGEKGLTFNGLLLIYDQGYLDHLDLDIHAVIFQLCPKKVASGQQKRIIWSTIRLIGSIVPSTLLSCYVVLWFHKFIETSVGASKYSGGLAFLVHVGLRLLDTLACVIVGLICLFIFWFGAPDPRSM